MLEKLMSTEALIGMLRGIVTQPFSDENDYIFDVIDLELIERLPIREYHQLVGPVAILRPEPEKSSCAP